jgi:hypothetical protein
MPDTDKPEREPIMRRTRPREESFAHFYLTKVALGEGCGCAEHALRLRELEEVRAGSRVRAFRMPGTIKQVGAVFARLGSAFGATRFGTPNPDP